ncbi:unnamed protein product, partial [Notodromas monacha]
ECRCQVIYTEKDACEQDKPGTNCLRGKFRKTFPCPEPTNAYSVSGTCSTAVCNKTSDCRPECKHHRELFLTANPTEVPFNESNIIKKVLEIGVGFQSSVSICLDNFAGLVEFDDTFFVSLSDKLTWIEWLKKHSSISLIIVSSALGAVLLLFLYFLVRSISRKCKRPSKKSEMHHQEIEEPMADLPDENQRLEIRKIPQGRFAVTNEHDRMRLLMLASLDGCKSRTSALVLHPAGNFLRTAFLFLKALSCLTIEFLLLLMAGHTLCQLLTDSGGAVEALATDPSQQEDSCLTFSPSWSVPV